MGSVTDAFRRLKKDYEEQESEQQEIFLQAGRAIVTLSAIEELMAEMFVHLSRPMGEVGAADMFYETQNFAHKIKLVDYSVRVEADDKTKASWSKLSERISTQHIVRTVAAHASMRFERRKENGKWVIWLGPQSRDKKKKQREYRVEDLRKAADELQKILDVARSMLKELWLHEKSARRGR